MEDKCFDSVVERCRYMAQVAKQDCMRNALTAAADELDAAMAEIEKLRSALRYQIMIYQVDDQAWDKNADADRIMSRVLKEA